MDVFLDTGFIVSLLIETDETENARKFFNLRTLLQAFGLRGDFYVGIKIIAKDRLGIRNPYSLREYIKKNGYNFADDFLNNMHEVFDVLEVINDVRDLKLIESIAKDYRLLPNDALIAATCKLLRNKEDSDV